jgi:hypothetical protein
MKTRYRLQKLFNTFNKTENEITVLLGMVKVKCDDVTKAIFREMLTKCE